MKGQNIISVLLMELLTVNEISLLDSGLHSWQQAVQIRAESSDKHADYVPGLDIALRVDCRCHLSEKSHNDG